MRAAIISICTLLGGLWFADIYDSNKGSLYVLSILMGAFAGWSISSVILKAGGNLKRNRHSTRMIGTITNIGYSTIRINNMPRYKVTIRYSGFEKAFEPIDPDIQFSLDIGDKAVVYVNPEKFDDAHFNVSESIKLKHQDNSSEFDTNAKFKLLEINPTNESSIYQLIGEVMQDSQSTRKASFEHRIDDANIMKLVPGMIIPCRIEGEGDDLEISMPIN